VEIAVLASGTGRDRSAPGKCRRIGCGTLRLMCRQVRRSRPAPPVAS